MDAACGLNKRHTRSRDANPNRFSMAPGLDRKRQLQIRDGRDGRDERDEAGRAGRGGTALS